MKVIIEAIVLQLIGNIGKQKKKNFQFLGLFFVGNFSLFLGLATPGLQRLHVMGFVENPQPSPVIKPHHSRVQCNKFYRWDIEGHFFRWDGQSGVAVPKWE